jgi:hypothetical protein
MKKTLITIATTLGAIILVTTVTYAVGGTLTPSGTAGDDTQYSLNDIYTKLTEGTDGTEGTGAMTVPESVSASFRTLTEIYNSIPATLSIVASTTTVPVGINRATTTLTAIDADLVAGNIADGVTVFGVVGELTSGGIPQTNATSTIANDDGDIQAGVAMSYTYNGDGTVTDDVTGLVWQQDGAYMASSWSDAISYCNSLALDGGGWRLPNYRELTSVVDLGRRNPSINPIFTHMSNAYYWTSSTYLEDTSYAYYVSLASPIVGEATKSMFLYYAFCVR